MQKNGFILSMVLIFALLIFVGCQPEEQGEKDETPTESCYNVAFADRYSRVTLPFDIAYQNGSDILFPDDIVAILKAQDELVSLCQDKRYPFFDVDDENFDRKLSRTIRSYDKTYFEDGALVFILLSQNNDFLSQIDRIKIEQDILTVYISNPEDAQPDENSVPERVACVYIVEMKKQSLETVDKAKIESIKKGNMSEYEKESKYSDFYALDYAYGRGMITHNDVRSIGFYFHSGKEWMGKDSGVELKNWEDFIETDYRPIEQNPIELSTETLKKIKSTYVDMVESSLKYYYEQKGLFIRTKIITEKDVSNIQYLGTYNGYAAVVVKTFETSLQQVTTPTISGITFYYANSGENILLFQEGE